MSATMTATAAIVGSLAPSLVVRAGAIVLAGRASAALSGVRRVYAPVVVTMAIIAIMAAAMAWATMAATTATVTTTAAAVTATVTVVTIAIAITIVTVVRSRWSRGWSGRRGRGRRGGMGLRGRVIAELLRAVGHIPAASILAG